MISLCALNWSDYCVNTLKQQHCPEVGARWQTWWSRSYATARWPPWNDTINSNASVHDDKTESPDCHSCNMETTSNSSNVCMQDVKTGSPDLRWLPYGGAHCEFGGAGGSRRVMAVAGVTIMVEAATKHPKKQQCLGARWRDWEPRPPRQQPQTKAPSGCKMTRLVKMTSLDIYKALTHTHTQHRSLVTAMWTTSNSSTAWVQDDKTCQRTRLDKALTHISQISGDCHVNNSTVWVQDDDTCQDDKTKHKAHTPSIAFQHLPPNSARISYATQGALFISVQLSSDVVSALWKVWVLIWLQKQPSTQAHM